MSNHRDKRRGASRDPYRERSPSRDSNRYQRSRDDSRSSQPRDHGSYDNRSQSSYQDHRRAQYDNDSRTSRGYESRGRGSSSMEDSRGLPSHIGSSRSYEGTQHTTVPGEELTELPSVVEIPSKVGAKLQLDMVKPRGRSGREITVAVNHFVIQSLPIVKIYQMEVLMRVPPSSQRRGSEKVSAMQQAKVLLQAKSFLGPDFVFDNVSLGWTTKLLMPVSESRSSTIDLPGHVAERPNQVEVTVRNLGPLNVRALVAYLQSPKSGTSSHGSATVEDCFKALNAIYRQDPASRFITRRNSSAFFQRSPSLMMTLQSTGGILEALRGAFQSVNFLFGRLTINVDVVTSAFYTPDVCMVDVARALCGVPPGQKIEHMSSSTMFVEACERIVGMFLCVRHLNSTKNSRKMRVQKLSTKGARETTFELKDHADGSTETISIFDYFMKRYEIKIRYVDLPLLICKDGMFPMELCFTACGERYKEVLQGQETADFINFATSPAHVRKMQIMDNVKRLHWHRLEIPKSMGLSVTTSMLQLLGRVLPSPIPLYGAGTDATAPIFGQWNLRYKKLLRPCDVSAWGLLYLPGGHRMAQEDDLRAFTRALAKSLADLGIRAPNSPPAMLKGNPQGSLKEEVGNLLGKTGNLYKRKPDLLLFLLHEHASPSIYKALKNLCEIHFGIPSQMLLVEKCLKIKGQPQYLANCGLKINCKLGGTNSSIDEPLFRKTRFMILGGDVSHPSPGELRKLPPPPSFCALVASYDKACVTYTAIASAQAATEELIDAFKVMAEEMLKRYQKKNGNLPQAIMYMRDGIAESQLPAFIASECKALKEACKSTGHDIKLTVVNCVKNHHTRLFPLSEKGDKLGNVPPGTVVEASPDKDIFLVSQSALQGTCRPCHYKKILDENNLSDDEFQRIIFNSTFSYGRATRSVSIHPAVYYADQVAERAKMHLRETKSGVTLHDAHPDLTYTMYWQ